jgi:hypothetical protein
MCVGCTSKESGLRAPVCPPSYPVVQGNEPAAHSRGSTNQVGTHLQRCHALDRDVSRPRFACQSEPP